MSGKPKHVLICCFDFPPNQGIGGRRWAKFAKSLTLEGFTVHVIKADPISINEISPWVTDTENPKIQVYSLPRWYPEEVSHPRKGLINKFRYFLGRKKILQIERGGVYDVATGWENVFRKKAIDLIERHQIKNVIASGAPWNLLVYAARLKEKFPRIHLITDYRDPWLTARNYGMVNLPQDRLEVEKKKQEYVWSKADIVTAPNPYLLDEIKKSGRIPEPGPSFRVLGHSFDEDDIIPSEEVSRQRNEKITFVYGGALYVEMEKHFQDWNNFLHWLSNNQKHYYERISIKIFTDNLLEAQIFREHSSVQIAPPIGKGIFNELSNADYCIMLLSHHNKNFHTTKFYEYLPLRKPFIFIGEEGEIARQIENDGLGIVIRDFPKDFLEIINRHDRGEFKYNKEFDLSSYTLAHRTRELVGMLR